MRGAGQLRGSAPATSLSPAPQAVSGMSLALRNYLLHELIHHIPPAWPLANEG